MKNAKGKPISEKRIEAALRRWEILTESLSMGVRASTHITAEDLRIIVY